MDGCQNDFTSNITYEKSGLMVVTWNVREEAARGTLTIQDTCSEY